MNTPYVIHGINGPVVTVTGGRGLAMMDMVNVGDEALIGEVVGVHGGVATVQVYEDTGGCAPASAWRASALPCPSCWVPACWAISSTASPAP